MLVKKNVTIGLPVEDVFETPDVPFSGSKAYAVAKRAMDVFSTGLNAEIEPQGIRVHCMHPGWADTLAY